ncbi:MAG: DUF1566 domain-containing protein [Candidatus Omnitrophota bacterium]
MTMQNSNFMAKRFSKYQSAQGFTLVEVLLSLVISMMLLSAVYNILIVGMKHWSQDDARGKLVVFNGDVVMRWLERDLREARTITFAKDREIEFTVCGESIPKLDNHTFALWHCDNPPDTTTIIYDASAAHHDGSLKGTGEPAWSTAGEHKEALNFDGVDDYVNCGSINMASAFTLEAWIRPDTANTDAAIIYNDNSCRLYLNSANQLVGSIYSSMWLDVSSKNTVVRDGNTWTYVALTYSQALQKLTIFINGAIAGTASYSAAVNPGTNVFLGRVSAGGGYPFDGLIDEVRISNVCRSMKTKFSWSGNSYASTGNPDDLLTKTSDEGAYQLEEGYVSVFQLDYYKKDGTEANTATQVGRDAVNSVKVNLTLQDEGVQSSLDSVIEERNMGQAGSAGGGLPDTGQTVSYTDLTFGEDHDYNSTATGLNYTVNGDGTITDNVTGLMWVIDSTAAGIGGSYNWLTAISNCEGLTYPASSYTDWRLPNIKELWSLVHYQNSNPSIASDFTCQNNKYWSSTTYSGGNTNAFAIDFQIGRCVLLAKTTSTYIRPVRNTGKLVDSGQTSVVTPGDDASFNPTAIQPDFIINEDTGIVKTVSDNISGLMWIKKPSDAGMGGTYTWELALAALNTCNAGTGIAGYKDWRMPNAKEMMSILNYENNTAPALNSTYFSPPDVSGIFWTGTSSVPSGLPSAQAEGVNIGDGTSASYDKTSVKYIFPVRGGA